MSVDSTYHEGELETQRRAGELELGRRNGAVIRAEIPRGAKAFLNELPYVFVGTRAPGGQPWAHILFGTPGFARTSDERSVSFDLGRAAVDESDPLWAHRKLDTQVGLLFVELESRRRLRVNGSSRIVRNELVVEATEAYPNCPKYVQRRALSGGIRPGEFVAPARTGRALPDDLQATVVKADTLVVASSHPGRGVDASHRGGRPGFVRVLDRDLLEIPDYPGNSMFNTLGNFVIDPRAGLLFIDFERARTLQVTGTVQVLWNREKARERTAGTERLWQLRINAWRETPLPAGVRWEFMDPSPFNPT